MKPLRCPKCRGTRILADRRTLKPYGWRVNCADCGWSERVSHREIVGAAILRWLAKDGGHIR